MQLFVTCLILSAFTAGFVFGQSAPAFDVASVKPTVREPMRTENGTVLPKPVINPGRVELPYVTLQTLLCRAYGVKPYQVSGPHWIGVTKFDVIATLPPSTSAAQVPEMLRTLLEDRFHLVVHHERRNLSVFEMVLAPGGLRAKGLDPDTPEILMVAPLDSSKHKLVGRATLGLLADRLSNILAAPTMDLTNASGVFKIDVDFDPQSTGDYARLNREPQLHAAPATDPAPSIFAAMEKQLGVRLQSRKAMVDVVVVDSANGTPTVN